MKGRMITKQNATSHFTRNSSQFKKIGIINQQPDQIEGDPLDDDQLPDHAVAIRRYPARTRPRERLNIEYKH